MRSNNVIILIVAIAMGGGAAYLARSWLNAHMNTAADQPAGHIVIAAEPLAYGTAGDCRQCQRDPMVHDHAARGRFCDQG